MRKAQGLPLTTIVIAAIALIVLVVVIVIFGGRMGWFAETARDCESLGGRCEDSCEKFGIATEIPKTDCQKKCCNVIVEKK